MSDQPGSNSPVPSEDGGAAGGNAASAPSSRVVGLKFVKQYYEILSTKPDQIFRFYKESSFLSDAEGSSPTDPKSFEPQVVDGRWGTGTVKRIDLQNGAIDAQPSINGSILVVVTGHVVFVDDVKEERKAFVQTFFLNLMGRRYYVHNDVLRFVVREPNVVSEKKSTTSDIGVVTEPAPAEEEPAVEELAEPEPEPPLEEPAPPTEDEAPGGGVEESKEMPPDDDEEEEEVIQKDIITAEEEKPAETAAAEEVMLSTQEHLNGGVEETKEEPSSAPAKDPEIPKDPNGSAKGKKGKGRGRSPPKQELQQAPPKQQPAPKPVPNSWASLVASGGGPSSVSAGTPPIPPSPAKPPPPTPEKTETSLDSRPPAVSPSPSLQDKQESVHSTSGGSRHTSRDRPKRDPDCTLVIKNLPENSKESDLVSLFNKFAAQTNAKIVGTTVSNHRGLGFVDFDSVAPVLAAVDQHSNEPMQLNGRILEVDQKTAEQRARRNMRGGYRSGSPGNGVYRGSGGGGRHNQYRRGNVGRGGERGGRGRGGR